MPTPEERKAAEVAAEEALMERIRAESAEIPHDPEQVDRIAAILSEERLDRIRRAAKREGQ
jgi:hypothetical protein